MTRAEFIEKNRHLFWYIKQDKIPEISNVVLVEFIFNYGTWEDVKELVEVLGYKELRRVYESLDERQKGNYFDPAINYLSLLTFKHAS
jgi:hypothetical protein